MTTDPPPAEHDITKEHYEAIGRVSNAWATFEFYTDEFIWWVANVDPPIGACITAQYIGPGPRFRALAALVKLRGGDAESIKSINRVSVAAQGVAGERNRLAHDPMFVDTETGEVLRWQVTADRVLVYELRQAKLAGMQSLEKKIWGLVADFKQMGKAIQKGLPPSSLPRKPPELPPRAAEDQPP